MCYMLLKHCSALPVTKKNVAILSRLVSATCPSTDSCLSPAIASNTDLPPLYFLPQRDDILITHATDIGWSPYFPVLGGVVTELGGLISHGAVVAREYGLPCVVGATGAADFFQSG